MLATSSRALVLLLSGAVLLGATDARRILPKPVLDLKPEPIAATATAPLYAHTQPPEQRVGHTIVHRQYITKPLNDPSSVSSLLSQLSTATAASSGTGSASATATGTSSSSSIPFLSIGSEPTDFGSSGAATATAKASGGGNGAAAALSVGSVRVGVVLAGALAAYMALA